MKNKKQVIQHQNNLARSYLFNKLLIFRIAKYSIMVITFSVMFSLIKDTTKPSDDIGWFSLGWNWMLLVLFGWGSWNVSKLVLDSVNQSRLSVIYVSTLLIYGIIILTDGKGKEITGLSQYIDILYFAVFPLCVPIGKHAISAFVNRRVSPLVARSELRKLIASILITSSIVMSYIIIYLLYINQNHVFQYDGYYERIILTALPFTSIGGISLYITTAIKNHGIHFKSWNKDKVKIVFIPIFLAVALWFFNDTFTFIHGYPIVTYITVVSLVGITMIIYSIFAKGEIASSNVATTIYGVALLIIWMLPFMYVSLYGYKYNMYTLINISSIGTIAILISITISDNSFTRAQAYAFAAVVLLLAATLFGYWFVESFDFNPDDLPLDLDTALLITFALVPTGFLQTGMWKIFIRQSSMSHWVNIERKVKQQQIADKKGVANA